jgi:hypothetical protein
MAKNDTKRGLYDVISRLFEIIKYMSAAERKEFLSVIISNLSESKRWDLLEKLETFQKSKLTESREHPRRPSFIPVECSSHEVCFTDFIQDISRGGVFIQTKFEKALSLI